MAGPASPQGQTQSSGKVDPETLALRAKPRRVTRFRRSVVIGVAATGSATIFALAFLALEGSSFRLAAPDGGELYHPERKERAEGLAALPVQNQLTHAMRKPGLPECSGVALGVDRLVMWRLKREHFDDVLAFPGDRA